jgi:opacity protein-like surface antigen
MKKSLFILLLLTLMTVSPVAAQQYKYEAGPTLGMTGYLGEGNLGSLFRHPSFTVGGLFRYTHNSRWAFKANLNYANIRGDSEKDETWYPDGANYTFSSSLIDLGLTAEFNFLNFGRGPMYKKYKPISPYMVAGVGFVFAINKGHNQASFTVPIGIGVKYKYKDRLNAGFEFTMRKEFSDRIDHLSDLYGIKHSFAKNTDWYSFAMFSVSYEFGKRCIKCNYIE